MFKKEEKSSSLYPPIQPDPLFHKRVFNKEYSSECYGIKYMKDDHPKLGWKERDTIVTALTDMLTEVDQRREALAKQRDALQRAGYQERDIESSEKLNGSSKIKANGTSSAQLKKEKSLVEDVIEEGKDEIEGTKEKSATIKVVGVEVTESCESGKPWSRPSSPIVPPLHLESPSPAPPPPSILLEGKVPAQAQLLISDSNETVEDAEDNDENEPTIMLSGKITLSVIPSQIRDSPSKANDDIDEEEGEEEEEEIEEIEEDEEEG